MPAEPSTERGNKSTPKVLPAPIFRDFKKYRKRYQKDLPGHPGVSALSGKMSKRTGKDIKKNSPASRGVPGGVPFCNFCLKCGHKGGGGEAAAPLVTTFLAKRCEKVLPGYSPRRREIFFTSFPVLFDIFLGTGGSLRPLFRFFLESRKIGAGRTFGGLFINSGSPLCRGLPHHGCISAPKNVFADLLVTFLRF